VTRSPLAVLIRWEENGASWRVRHRSDTLAVIDLCTCHGEPVDELRTSDPELLLYLAHRLDEAE
jgi:hypothetical protein